MLERQPGKEPGEEPTYFPDWGFAEPRLMAMPTGAHLVVWQKGNNKAVALDGIATEGRVLYAFIHSKTFIHSLST